MNTEVHTSFQIMVFSGYMPRSGTAGSYSSSIFVFLRKLHTILGVFILNGDPVRTVFRKSRFEKIKKGNENKDAN